MQKERIYLLDFGRGGHAEHGVNWTRSGYEDPESYTRRDDLTKRIAEGSAEIDPAGIPVIDKRAAVETKAGYAWVFAGPLLDVRLKDGECSALDTAGSIVAQAVKMDDGNAFGQIVQLHEAQKATKAKRGALDSVSVSEYVQGWREHGARIGRLTIENGAPVITWEN